MGGKSEITLFGGDVGWDTSDWTSSDDRVRGGSSQSYLDISGSSARFHGNLDIKTLGGAGFASQRTTGEGKSWDLSKFDGLRLDLGKADNKRYTFILKDEILPKSPGGREQSTISYEYDFTVSEDAALAESSFIYMPWKDLKPTYRGKEKKDAPKLDKKDVKRLSIMMRSFFGDQEGDFSLNIKSIKAVCPPADLEKGFTGAKNEGPLISERVKAENSANAAVGADTGGGYIQRLKKSKLLPALGVGFVGVCLFACYWRRDDLPDWHW